MRSNSLTAGIGQFPQWLLALAAMIAFNAMLVGWSVVDRHLRAEPPAQALAEEHSATPNQPMQLTDPERLKALEAPELSTSDASSSVPADDPLLSEIRKQAELHFPKVFTQQGQTIASSPPAESDPLQVTSTATSLATRLSAVGKLNDAAMLLVELSAHQRELGQNDQSELSLARVQQLRGLMIELLSE